MHLGTLSCKAEQLLRFLKHHDCETLFLVGDIIDGWRLKQHWYWPSAHDDVLAKVMSKARDGTRVIFIPGNHDDFARRFTGVTLGNLQIEYDWVHETADGRCLLVLHGDKFDSLIHNHRWLGLLATRAHAWFSLIDAPLNLLRALLKLPGWSLSSYLKEHARSRQGLRSTLIDLLLAEAKARGLDGVVCGHVHHAEIVTRESLVYCNDGDWVKSCSALVETFEGELEILYFTEN